jgi:hypothetical protein
VIVVIQCAATKKPDAGRLMTTFGKPVMFVGHPQVAPRTLDHTYARPDDLLESGVSWRQILLKYNEHPETNPFGLYPAYELYENTVYKRLVDRLGLQNVYILSAGWGLIRAGFLTPQYDITFSQTAEPYKRRGKRERYDDFCMLPEDVDNVFFFGGKDYLPLFCTLTSAVRGGKTVFYNSQTVPETPGCRAERFETTTRTNWHYECVNAFLDRSKGRPSAK